MLGYALALKIRQNRDPVPHREVELDQGTPHDDMPALSCVQYDSTGRSPEVTRPPSVNSARRAGLSCYTREESQSSNGSWFADGSLG